MSIRFHLRTTTPEDTRSLAGAVAGLVEPGDVIVLSGDLGAGKTAFTQGLGAALGVTAPIVSPTFTIERIYDGRVRLHHLDVYRLDHVHEALDLGLAESLDDGDVAVIEWGDAVASLLGLDALVLRFTLGDGDDDRDVTVELPAESWSPRADRLAAALAPWRADAPGSRAAGVSGDDGASPAHDPDGGR